MNRKSEPKTRWLILLLFVLLSSCLYLPVILGRKVFAPGDFTYHYLFFNDYLIRQVRSLTIPVWNLYNYSGQPFLADPQASAFYPVKYLFLLPALFHRFSLEREMYLLELNSIGHLALAGWFTFLFVEELLQSREAGVLAGLTYAFSGFLAGYPMLQQTILQASVWLPAVLWMILLGFKRGMAWKYWIAASVLYAISFLAGHPQIFWMSSYVIVAWMLLLWVHYRSRTMTFVQRAAVFYFLVMLLSSPQLLPTLEFTHLSARIHSTYAELSGGLPLRDGWQVIFSSLFTKFSPLYAGVGALGLWMISLGWLFGHTENDRKWMPSLVVFWSAVLAFFLLLSFGGNAFLYRLVYGFLPGGRLFRDQERAAFMVSFSFSVLSGLGFLLLSEGKRRVRLLSFVFLAFSATSLVAMMLTYRVPVEFLYKNHALLLKVTKLFTGGLLLAVVSWIRGNGKWKGALLSVFVLADLFSLNYGLIVENRPLSDWNPIAPQMAMVQSVAGQGRISVFGRVHNEYRLPGNYGMPISVEDTLGGSSLRLGRYKRLFERMPLGRFWDVTGVQFVVTWRKKLFFPSRLLGTFRLPGSDTSYFHELENPFPKARIVHRVKCLPDDAALKSMASFDLDFGRTALIPPGACDYVRLRGGVTSEGRVKGMIEEERGRTTVFVDSPSGGLLVVSQNWVPGWHAFVVDGEGRRSEARVVRADYAFVGVLLPPGAEKVVLRYMPDTVRYGLLIGAISWVFVLASLFRGFVLAK